MTEANREKSRAGRSAWAVAGLILALALPSFQVVEKFLGVAGLVGYLGVVVIAVWVGGRHLLPELQSRVSERPPGWWRSSWWCGASSEMDGWHCF